MLAATTYTKTYVDACRAEIAGQLAAYRALLAASGAKIASGKEVLAFARPFFNNLVLAMDRAFVHRTRALELKEAGYKPVAYVPREDVDMRLLERTERVTTSTCCGAGSISSTTAPRASRY